jgi:hypothetical protein
MPTSRQLTEIDRRVAAGRNRRGRRVCAAGGVKRRGPRLGLSGAAGAFSPMLWPRPPLPQSDEFETDGGACNGRTGDHAREGRENHPGKHDPCAGEGESCPQVIRLDPHGQAESSRCVHFSLPIQGCNKMSCHHRPFTRSRNTARQAIPRTFDVTNR